MSRLNKLIRYPRKFFVILKEEGLLNASSKAHLWLRRRLGAGHSLKPKFKFLSLVDRQSVMRANWTNNPYRPSDHRAAPPLTVNWIMSPPGGGGGHQNIFRFIEHTERLGYKNNVYIYSGSTMMTLEEARKNVSDYCRAKNLSFFRYGEQPLRSADILFATGWETAYPVFNEQTSAKKMYFVQDFEPYFYPVGTDYVLAENTYRFGFHGITAGRFLADKLSGEYGMQCDYYSFGVEGKMYQFTNTSPRKEVFFYARPVTERRGFDLGIMALELFHQQNPSYVINLAGWDVSEHEIPFPHINHKALPLKDLPALYNRCAAALIISLTNMSLLPLEVMACGAIPVINDGPNNRKVSDNQYIAYTSSSPVSLAEKMTETVRRPDLTGYSQKAAKSVDSCSWEEALKTFTRVVEKEVA
jgi:O-antigen biosynthesis protein